MRNTEECQTLLMCWADKCSTRNKEGVHLLSIAALFEVGVAFVFIEEFPAHLFRLLQHVDFTLELSMSS